MEEGKKRVKVSLNGRLCFLCGADEEPADVYMRLKRATRTAA